MSVGKYKFPKLIPEVVACKYTNNNDRLKRNKKAPEPDALIHT